MERNQILQAARAVQRAETPYLLYADDVAVTFRLEVHAARDAIAQGSFGPWFTVRGEPAVLRETLRQHIGVLIAQRAERDRELLVPQGGEERGDG